MSLHTPRDGTVRPKTGPERASPRTTWVDRALLFALVAAVLFAVAQMLPLSHMLERASLRAGLARRHLEPVAWPEFRLLDDAGRTVSRSDLAGTVWIADVFSLQCTDCRPLSGRIADVQQRLRDRSVRFVSFSIDRTTTAGALAQQRARYQRVDSARWTILQSDSEHVPHLLVALELAADLRLARAGICSLRPHFFLIDRRGQLRGTYAADDPRQLEWLASDADALASAGDGHTDANDESQGVTR